MDPVDLLARLIDRGLDVPDRDRALRYLRHIGYYRLSAYMVPFQLSGPGHLFTGNATFDEVLDLYVFDRALRLLVMDAVERVEVAVRAALTDHMSMTHIDPHWYLDAAHFKNHGSHRGLLEIVQKPCDEQLKRAPESSQGSLVPRSALEHYLTTYSSPALPPCWLMVETLAIGQLASIYRNLRARGDRSAIAASVGLTDPVLSSWMGTYTRVRNISAHHGRLWNVGLGVYPAIPTTTGISWLRSPGALPKNSQRRLYPVLVSLQSVLDTISPYSSWAQRLYNLLAARPPMNLRGMGVPQRWAEDDFWARHLA